MRRRKNSISAGDIQLVLVIGLILLAISLGELILAIVFIYVASRALIAIVRALINFAALVKWNSTNIEWNDIDIMEGVEFESLVANALRDNGFHSIHMTPASGDYGVDIVAYKRSDKYVFQCKRYNPGKSIGIRPIQEAYTGKLHYGADVAIVVTNLYFSKNAQILARETGVVLWDRSELEKLIIGFKK